MTQTARKIKKAKVSRVMVVELRCPECDECIEMANSSTMVVFDEWDAISEVLTCQECGTQVERPANPFKRK